MDAIISGVIEGIGSLTDKAQQEQKRGNFTQETVKKLMDEYPDKNVMICCTDCTESFQGVEQHLEHVNYGFTNYQVWVFESGSFDLHGDGGFINWCFGGEFKRSGSHVEFSKRS